jgi:hypothetical protein
MVFIASKGVNDVVQGVSSNRYQDNVSAALDALLTRLPAGRLLTVTTPDYALTAAGADHGDPVSPQAGIVRINTILPIWPHAVGSRLSTSSTCRNGWLVIARWSPTTVSILPPRSADCGSSESCPSYYGS